MKIISTIKQWHKENRQYDGFFEFECFSCLTLFLFAGNICIHNTTAVDWLIWVIWLQSTLFYAYKWLHNRSQKEILDFVKDRCKEMIDELIVDEYKERERLISANRRRKRAELALKKCRKTLRCVRTVRFEYEKKCSEYEDALITAYTATYDYSVKAKVSEEDIAHAKEARVRFNEYMGKHYEEMARNKFWREWRQDVFDCLYFPHSEFTPEHTDGFYHLLQNGGNDGAVVDIKENQEL